MADVNRSIFTGNVVKDSEILEKENFTIARFCIASNRTKMQQREDGTKEYISVPYYLNTQLFGQTAKNIGVYLKTGVKVSLEGHWENRNWEKDGVKHYKDQFIVEQLNFLSKKQTEKSEKTSTVTQTQGSDFSNEIDNAFNMQSTETNFNDDIPDWAKDLGFSE